MELQKKSTDTLKEEAESSLLAIEKPQVPEITEAQRAEIDLLNVKIKKAVKISRKIDAFIFIVLLLIGAYIGSTIYDSLKILQHGKNTVTYHDFDELLKENPDTVAWLTLEGTTIDHPIVQGKDNFEYLDKDFRGEHYTGGTLFLDEGNNKKFTDDYNIIHGHHMEGGAMFGDLTKYKEENFFKEHSEGVLLTPTYDYDLEVIGVAAPDAYDSVIYTPKNKSSNVYAYAKQICTNIRDVNMKDSKILTLSTCSGEMNDNRCVVFCRMYNKHKHK